MNIKADDREIATWINVFNERVGHSPTVRELAEAFGVSVGTAHLAISRLAGERLITVEKPRRRKITVNMEAVDSLK